MPITGPLGPPTPLHSIREYTGNGTQINWEFAFDGGYLSQANVKVTVISPTGVKSYPTFTFAGYSTLTISPAVPSGHTLVIYRDTPKETPTADFGDGAVISEKNLDDNAKQAVFVAAEAIDSIANYAAAFDQLRSDLEGIDGGIATLARLDQANNFTGQQSVTGDVLLNGSSLQRVTAFANPNIRVIASVTGGVSDESALLQAAATAMPDNSVLWLVGRWRIGSEVLINARTNVTIDGYNALVILDAKAWAPRTVGIRFRDCVGGGLGSGVTIQCSGTAFLAGGFTPVTGAALVSSVAGPNVWAGASSKVKSLAKFVDMACPALKVRLNNGAQIGGTFLLKRDDCAMVEIARSDDVQILPATVMDGVTTPAGWNGDGSLIVISPGGTNCSDEDAELYTRPGINGLGPTHQFVPFEATAPTGTTTWVLPFHHASGYAHPGYDYAINQWTFLCYDANGSEELHNDQFVVGAIINEPTKTVSLTAKKVDGTPVTFQGQKFRIDSICTARYCKNFTVSPGVTLSNAAGSGVFALACDGVKMTGVTAYDTMDYRLGTEWSNNVTISGCILYSRLVGAYQQDIGFLFRSRNCTSTGNTMGTLGSVPGGVYHHNAGWVCAGISSIDDKMLYGGVFTISDAAGPTFVDGITVRGLRQRGGASSGIYLVGSMTLSNCLKNVTVSGNNLVNNGQVPIAIASVQRGKFTFNQTDGARYRGLMNIIGSGAATSDIDVAWNTATRFGSEYIGGMPLVQFSGAGAAPAVRFTSNTVDDPNHPLYLDGALAALPVLSRGEAVYSWDVGALAPQASITSPSITVLGVRVGDRVAAWCKVVFPGVQVVATATALDTIQLTATNVSGAALMAGAKSYGAQHTSH